MHPFGARAYLHLPEAQRETKQSVRAEEAILIGNNQGRDTKGWLFRVYQPDTKSLSNPKWSKPAFWSTELYANVHPNHFAAQPSRSNLPPLVDDTDPIGASDQDTVQTISQNESTRRPQGQQNQNLNPTKIPAEYTNNAQSTQKLAAADGKPDNTDSNDKNTTPTTTTDSDTTATVNRRNSKRNRNKRVDLDFAALPIEEDPNDKDYTAFLATLPHDLT